MISTVAFALPVDQGVQVAQRQQAIHLLTRNIEKLHRRGAAYDQAAYQARMQHIWTSLYRAAGVPRGAKFEQITDCSVLDRIVEVASVYQPKNRTAALRRAIHAAWSAAL